ncbi:MAG: hypothetical protein OXC01_16865 [Immundisolibacterales bacterium]|nr:hypothetical protein [Immundisolibacterales bacterium]
MPEILTAHVITACHALSHRIALRAEEVALLDEQGQALTPAFWCETKAMFALADQADGPFELDLGFSSLIYRWLGLQDESELLHRFGMTISEALALDSGNLAALASSLEQGQRSGGESLALPISHAWSARASRLMDDLPETGELVLLTLERALDGCPWEPDWIRPLFEALVHVASQVGDESRERQARKMLATIDAEVSSREPAPFLVGVAAQLLTSLWCIAHKGLLLQDERTLFPGINPSHETWDRVGAAIKEGGVDTIPIPVLLLQAWGAPEEATEEAVRGVLREDLEVLAQVSAEVERLWGDNETTDVPEAVARSVAAMAVIRHTQLRSGFRPIPGEPQCPFYELHQGARRAKTVELAELLRRLRDVLERAAIDPLAVADAHLDAARESQALGTHRATRSHLAAAMRSASQHDGEPSRRDHGAACVAQFLWQSGEPDEAMQRLLGIEGELAGSLVRTIEAHDREREALRRAEQSHLERDDVETVCALVTSNAAAGHPVRAEVIARDACERWPGDPRTWEVLARVLFVAERYREAIDPCRKALSKGTGRTPGASLLARILSHVGAEGRDESVRLAAQAIEADDARDVLPSEILAELADIVHYAGPDIAPARLADDLVGLMRVDAPAPAEWLGAAVARRSFGIWSDDAVAFLARLVVAGKDAPAALARFVVERVEALLWWRSLIERRLNPPVLASPADTLPKWHEVGRLKATRHASRSDAVGLVLRAAVSLGYVEPDLDDADAETGPGIAFARHWEPHLPLVESCFGQQLAVCLRASELAQVVWFGAGEVSHTDLLVALETFDNERIGWIRWAGESGAIGDTDAIPGLTPETRVRLLRVFEAGEYVEDAAVRDAGSDWSTRWHETERR